MSEPALVRVPLEAWLCVFLWVGGLGAIEEAGVGVRSRSSNAVSPFSSEYGALRITAWAFPGELLLVRSSCGLRCFVISFPHHEAKQF